MGKSETFQPLKSTLQKRNILTVTVLIFIACITFVVYQNSCELQHVNLLADIDKYEQTLDPDLCHSLIERIDSINDNCDVQVEILDCG